MASTSSESVGPAQPDCVFCGLRGAPIELTRPHFVIRKCPHCHVLWCDPPHFERAFRPDNEDAYLEVEDAVHNEGALRLAEVRRHAPPHSHPRLVEVGCMHGDFVIQARQAGYRAQGLDLSPTAIEYAKRVAPDLVELGTLDGRIGDGTVDVVAAFNVVEHMARPDRFLDDVLRVLRRGGLFVAETPARESVYHQVLFLRGRLQPRGGFEVGLHPGTHVFKFGRKAWRQVLRDRGFEVLEVTPRSTPLRELLAKNKSDPIMRAGIVGFGLLGRATGWENRVLVVARRI